MMGPRQEAQCSLFYEFSLDEHVPGDHLMRSIDRFVDLSGIRSYLAPYYSPMGRPSVDPELMIRMLLIGYCMGIRSERRLCEEVHLNLAYRWFCRLDLADPVPDHSTFSKNRHGRFRDSDLFRQLFERVLERCIAEGLVGGDSFGVDASLIKADASRYAKVEAAEWSAPEQVARATQEYLDTLDDAAFGGATPVQPKTLSPSDPAARFTGANGDRPFFAYSTNYLVDLEHAIIVDVEATAPIRQAETGAAREMILRTRERFGLYPGMLAADTAYGSAEMLGWLVEERGIEPHIPVFDKSGRKDGTYPATDFVYDHEADAYTCPGGNALKPYWRAIKKARPAFGKDGFKKYFARKDDCAACALKPRCTPNQATRKISRSRHEGARQMARDIAKTDAYVASSYARKKVEMLFAHLKRILGLDRLRLRGPNGAKDEFNLAAMAQNLRKLAKLVPIPT
ncbi:MAG: IS1182 family transposase [Desulfuromonadales bacterium]|nr:IS1182 family transposase [Pseudomonadales bacterium]NIQ93020.1 IS1182 family transposase [Desulfuromonadales bacterium]NIS39392.1 IS1182 family transposase [Desulfuromonadales bacterium]NIX06981.1 IS1182 family transposase [Pseudomonadales bacterium]